MTAVPNAIRLVRWLAAARRATGEEMPGCRCRWRTQTLSKPSSSARSISRSVCSWPGAGSAASNCPMVRNPSRRNGRPRSGILVIHRHVCDAKTATECQPASARTAAARKRTRRGAQRNLSIALRVVARRRSAASLALAPMISSDCHRSRVVGSVHRHHLVVVGRQTRTFDTRSGTTEPDNSAGNDCRRDVTGDTTGCSPGS